MPKDAKKDDKKAKSGDKKEKKDKKKKEKTPEPEPVPEPEPAKKSPWDDEGGEDPWGAVEEEAPPAEAPAEGEEAFPADGEAPPAEGEEGAPPAEGEAPAEGEGTPAEPEPEEPLYVKKIQIGAHWRKPYMHLYSYNWDVEEFYYKPLVDSLDKKSTTTREPVGPGAQTFAERCVKYWPGQGRRDQVLYEIEQERERKKMERAKTETNRMVQEKIIDEPPKYKDPLDKYHPLTIARKTCSQNTLLSKAAVERRTTHKTDQVMDIFGLHVPEASSHDSDLALFLRRLRKPVQPDINEISLDLDRGRKVHNILAEERLTPSIYSPIRYHGTNDLSPPKSRPSSVIGTTNIGSEYNVERSSHIEQTARFMSRRKHAWKY